MRKAMFLLIFFTIFNNFSVTTSNAALVNIKLNKTSAVLAVSETIKLSVKGTNKVVKWSSSNKKIATVSKTGKVTAKSIGEVIINAKVGSRLLICKIKVQNQKITPPKAESSTNEESPSKDIDDKKSNTITIQIGNKSFKAILYDNATVKAFIAQLPLSLNMSELNGNEKYYNLPNSFTTNSEQVGNINTGDLMLYGSDCLVLFYKSFSTSYSYTKLGYIEDTTGLSDALGDGKINVVLILIDNKPY